jgi:hypothetical protein
VQGEEQEKVTPWFVAAVRRQSRTK